MNATAHTPAPQGDGARLDPLAPRPATHVLAAKQSDRTVLLDLHRGRYYTLDGVGGRIWELLDAGCELAEVEDRLSVEYDAPRERIAHDVAALLDELTRRGLVS